MQDKLVRWWDKWAVKIFIFAAVLGVALFAATYSLQFIATTIYSLIMAMVMVRRKEHLSIWLTCFVILMYVLIFTIPPLYLHSASVARYKLQRGYIGLYNNVKEPSGLPDYADDMQELKFEYSASVGKHIGYYSVSFTTARENAEAYEVQLAEKAKHAVPLRKFKNGAEIGGEKITLRLDESWKKYYNSESSAMLYILTHDVRGNAPILSAAVIDPAAGKVQFLQMGYR